MLGSIYLAGGWIIRLVMIPVVARHHRPLTALAWLAPIFLFPVLGTLLYLWLAYYGLQRNARAHRRVRREVERDDEMRQQRRHQSRPTMDAGERELVRLTERLSTRQFGGFPILGGNAVELLDAPGEAVERLIADIEAARDHVHLLFYIYIADETGTRLADALCRAAERGVECRLLVDAWASRELRRSLGVEMQRRGVELHAALPMHPLARVDIRNHRKLAVIDGRAAYTGSTNIHDPGHALQEGVWHQISVRMEGPAVLQLQMVFVEDWYFAAGRMLQGERYFPEPERPGEVPIQTVPDGPSYQAKILQHVVVQALQAASRSVVLTTPYFVPDEASLISLRLAALRGVEVDLVLPRTSDRRVADLAARTYFEPLLDAGARVHLHPSGILHAKTITIDERLALVGTANFDRRSFFLNYEVVLILYGDDFARRLRASQQRFLDASVRLRDRRGEGQSTPKVWLEHTAKLLSPVL